MRRSLFAVIGLIAYVGQIAACGSFAAEESPAVDASADANGTPDGPEGGTDGDASATTRVYIAGGQVEPKQDDAFPFTTSVAFATVQANGSLSSWQTTTGLPNAVHATALVATSSSLLLLGGEEGTPAASSAVPATRSAGLLPAGGVGGWQATRTLPDERFFHAAIAVGSYVYVVGGRSLRGLRLASVLVAPLDGSGAPGTFKETAPLAAPRSSPALASDGTFLYVVGGSEILDGGVEDCKGTVLSAKINKVDGTLEAWRGAGSFPPRKAAAAAISRGKIYMLGGLECGGNISKQVFGQSLVGDGSLTGGGQLESLPTARWGLGSVAIGGRLYAIGGDVGGGLTDEVLFAAIESDGLSPWQLGPPMPAPRSFFGVSAR